jgi:YHS domain-containing protein
VKEEFVKCSYCKAEMPTEACKLAAYRKTIEGKQYVFCCANCAQRFEKKGKPKSPIRKPVRRGI